jgi:hypothetical protein
LPKWDDELIFLNTAGINVMQVEVWDKDVTTNDLVGQGELDFTSAMNNYG